MRLGVGVSEGTTTKVGVGLLVARRVSVTVGVSDGVRVRGGNAGVIRFRGGGGKLSRKNDPVICITAGDIKYIVNRFCLATLFQVGGNMGPVNGVIRIPGAVDGPGQATGASIVVQ